MVGAWILFYFGGGGCSGSIMTFVGVVAKVNSRREFVFKLLEQICPETYRGGKGLRVVGYF